MKPEDCPYPHSLQVFSFPSALSSFLVWAYWPAPGQRLEGGPLQISGSLSQCSSLIADALLVNSSCIDRSSWILSVISWTEGDFWATSGFPLLALKLGNPLLSLRPSQGSFCFSLSLKDHCLCCLIPSVWKLLFHIFCLLF